MPMLGFCSSIARDPQEHFTSSSLKITHPEIILACWVSHQAHCYWLTQRQTQMRSKRASDAKTFLHSFASRKSRRTHNLSSAVCTPDKEEKDDICKGVHKVRAIRRGHVYHSFSLLNKSCMLKTLYIHIYIYI